MFYITSTFSMNSSLRNSLAGLQTELAQRQKELTTGRIADLGQTLGMRSRLTYSLQDAYDTAQTTFATNQIVQSRLDTTQNALTSIVTTAQAMRATLLTERNNGGDRSAAEKQARESLTTFISTLNASDGGAFVFGGINTTASPLNDYFANPASDAQAAVDAAFSNAFGISATNAQVQNISSSDVQAFLSGSFDALFSDGAWAANWSNASSDPIRARISMSQTIDASASAKDPALQKLAMTYVMMSELGATKMSQPAYEAVLDKAISTIDDGITLLNKTQARVGVMQNDVKCANDQMTIQSTFLETQISTLQSSDPTETAARVNGLMTQIEVAYSLTAKISQLSLVKYL